MLIRLPLWANSTRNLNIRILRKLYSRVKFHYSKVVTFKLLSASIYNLPISPRVNNLKMTCYSRSMVLLTKKIIILFQTAISGQGSHASTHANWKLEMANLLMLELNNASLLLHQPAAAVLQTLRRFWSCRTLVMKTWVSSSWSRAIHVPSDPRRCIKKSN